MVPVTEMGFMVGEEERGAPTIEPTALPLEAVTQDSSEKVSIDGAPTEMAPKMSVEGCSKKDPIEKVRMEEAIDNLEKDPIAIMETERSLEMATPIRQFLTSTAYVGPSDQRAYAYSI